MKAVYEKSVEEFITGTYLALLTRLKRDTTYWECANEFVDQNGGRLIKDLSESEIDYVLQIKKDLQSWKLKK